MRLPLSLALLVLPLVEIAGFIVVGRGIGVLATLGLVLLSGLIGSLLMRLQGFGLVARIRSEVAAGRNPAREVVHGVMVLAAGILLMIPGFFTDLIGLLLFVPAVRDVAWRYLRRRLASSRLAGDGRRTSGQVLDLDRSDYASRPDPPARLINDE